MNSLLNIRLKLEEDINDGVQADCPIFSETSMTDNLTFSDNYIKSQLINTVYKRKINLSHTHSIAFSIKTTIT